MKHRLIIHSSIFISIVILLLLSGCVKEPVMENEISDKFEIQLTIPNSFVVETRSENDATKNYSERYIREGYFFAFRPDSTQISNYYFKEENVTQNSYNSNPKITVSRTALESVNTNDRVVFVINAKLRVDINTVTLKNLNEAFELGGATSVGYEVPWNGTEGGLPMYGEDLWSTTGQNNVTIKRAVAKIQVQIPQGGLGLNDVTGLFNFGDVRFQLTNATVGGAVNGGVVAIPFRYGNQGLERRHISSSGDNFSGAHYIYQFPYSTGIVDPDNHGSIISKGKNTPDPRRLAIILIVWKGGEETWLYYRLDLCNRDSNGELSYLNVDGNNHYIVNIKKVGSAGYENVEDALRNPASNIEYEIIDASGDHTISNGQYAMSVKNVYDGLVYRSNQAADEEVEFMKLKYISDNNIPPVANVKHVYSGTGDIKVKDNLNNTLTSDYRPLNLTITGQGVGTITTTVQFGNLTPLVKSFYVDKQHASFAAHSDSFEITGQMENNTDGVTIDGFFIKNMPRERIKIWTPGNVIPHEWKKLNEQTDTYDILTGDFDPDSEEYYNAIPYFKDKSISTEIKTGNGDRIKVIVRQSAPVYIGRYGSPMAGVENSDAGKFASLTHPTAGVPLRKRAIMETGEVVLTWGEKLLTGDLLDNVNHGLYISKFLDQNGKHGAASSGRPALHECYKKNAGWSSSGVIIADDQVKWYLPAQQQLAGIWTILNTREIKPYGYLSATERDSYESREKIWYLDFLSGDVGRTALYITFNVRCIRDL